MHAMFVLVVVLVVIRTHATCRGNGNDDDGGDSAMNVYCKGNDCVAACKLARR